MKKVAIISPIARVNIDLKSIRSLEVKFLKERLEKESDIEFYYVSKKIKETDPNYINIFDLDSLNQFDEIYIHNYNTNFFGGLVGKLTVKYLQLIANYKGIVYYYITDPKLKYANLFDILMARTNLKYETPISKEELLELSLKYKEVENNIDACFSGYNYQPIYGHNFKYIKYVKIFDKLIDMEYKENNNDINKIYDICYYGDNRGTYRNNKIKKYFNTDKLNTLLIGCKLEGLKNNIIHDKVPQYELSNVVNTSYAAIVIGDKEHENSFITARFYENIKFGVVSFIDIDYDNNKLLYKDQFLKDFCYITSQDDLISKIEMIKSDKLLYNKIIEKQNKELELIKNDR